MFITSTQLKANIGKYLYMATKEDIFVTKNGKAIAKITDPSPDKQAILDSLVGITAANPVTPEEAKAERMVRQ